MNEIIVQVFVGAHQQNKPAIGRLKVGFSLVKRNAK